MVPAIEKEDTGLGLRGRAKINTAVSAHSSDINTRHAQSIYSCKHRVEGV